MITRPTLADLSPTEREELEAFVVDFDCRWATDGLSDWATQVPPDTSSRLPTLAEMVKVDLEKQWTIGNRLALEAYLKDYPELGGPGEVAADLIFAEYRVRCQFDAPVDLDDYARRFPNQFVTLGRLVAQEETDECRDVATTKPEIPVQFGRYRIIRHLGKGGMGSVYLAGDTSLERPVALKLSHFGADPNALKRFEREARALAALDHPNICRVYDNGILDGLPFMVMQYVPGGSLAEAVNGRGLPPREAAELVAKLARAIRDVHARGILHRDLKPLNIIRKPTDWGHEPVIVDFGLAHREGPTAGRLTQPGQGMGTIPYMPLEQLNGELERLGPPCDIYALGATLYELLTGRPPFRGTITAIIHQKMHEPPPSPRDVRPEVDPHLGSICRKAMAREIADRYASMGEMADALDAFLRTTAEPGRPEEPEAEPEPPRDRGPRRPRLALAAAGFGAIALPGIIIILTINKDEWSVRIPNEPPREGRPVPKPQEPGPPPVPAPSPSRSERLPRTFTNSIGMAMVRVEPGTFLMGSSDANIDKLLEIYPAFLTHKQPFAREKPQHEVRITRPFYLGSHEVTVGQFRKFAEGARYRTEAEVAKDERTWRNPGFAQTDDHPVVYVSHRDAKAFCEWLTGSRPDDRRSHYRLPTEAEWEYACRGGMSPELLWPNGNDPEGLAKLGNVCDASSHRTYPQYDAIESDDGFVHTAPVGSFPPNARGLHDMIGNVAEWCQDELNESAYHWLPTVDPVNESWSPTLPRVFRGGYFGAGPYNCRPASRMGGEPGYRYMTLGFRVAAEALE